MPSTLSVSSIITEIAYSLGSNNTQISVNTSLSLSRPSSRLDHRRMMFALLPCSGALLALPTS